MRSPAQEAYDVLIKATAKAAAKAFVEALAYNAERPVA